MQTPLEPTERKCGGGRSNLVPFKSGAEWKGNAKGRPKGSRNLLAEAFFRDLYALWEIDGVELMRAAALKNPVAMVQVVAAIAAKETGAEASAQVSWEDALRALA